MLKALDDLEQLSADAKWFVRCVLIARGGAKALVVQAETRLLIEALRILLRVSTAFHEALSVGSEAPQAPWASDLEGRANASSSGAMPVVAGSACVISYPLSPATHHAGWSWHLFVCTEAAGEPSLHRRFCGERLRCVRHLADL